MDFHCIEELLALPEFRVIHQVMCPKQFEFHLERRDMFIVCPRCRTCCSRVQDSRPRCIRDLPILERPVVLWLHLRRFECAECHHRPWEKSETFGAHVKWTERLYTHVRQEYLHGCPCRELARRYGLSERTVFRWTGFPQFWSKKRRSVVGMCATCICMATHTLCDRALAIGLLS
jgi:transposase